MSTEVEQIETTQEDQPTTVDATQQLQKAVWDEAPMQAIEQEQPTTVVEKKEETVVEPPPTINEWWKDFEFESAEKAKEEITQLRELKNKQPEEIKFANDESKRLYDLIREGKTKEAVEVISTQERLQSFSTAEVNKDNAADIIKMGMSLRNTNLSTDEINFLYKQEYSIPKEPVFNDLKETEEEFQARHSEWKETVANVEMKRMVAAKMAQPELAKLKSELVLPDISTPNSNNQTTKQPTQEEIAAAKKVKEEWVKAANGSATQFKGFSTTATYKDGDKDIEIPVSYGLSEDEKKSLNTKLSAFAESGFDPYTILKERWIDESGNDKLDQVIEDLSWLMFGKKAAQKFANEAAHQRMENFLKEKKNITIGGGNNNLTPSGEKSELQQLQEQVWNN